MRPPSRVVDDGIYPTAMSTTDSAEARRHDTVQALLALLADTDRMTRIGAAQDLGALGDPAAVTPLLHCLHASDDLLRTSAVNALAKIGDPSAVPALLDVAKDDEASGVRVTAVDALATLGDPRAIDLLGRLALDPRPLIATPVRWFTPSWVFRSRLKEVRQTRRWALKRLRKLHAIDALPILENGPRPRSLAQPRV